MSAPRLEVDFSVTLRSGQRSFALQVRFASEQNRIVLFGPSGAGKTATLRAIAGLLRPAQGRIAAGGRVLFDAARGIDLAPRLRRVGYVFQDYALFPHLNVRDNVGYGLRRGLLRGWFADAAARKRIDAMLDLFDLGALAAMPTRELSGGQRQRVALARALIVEPTLLLLDEPFAALDVRLRDRMREELRELQMRFAVPLVLITHDLMDVQKLAETLVVIEMGQVTRSLSMDASLQSPPDGSMASELARLCGVF
jgi:molybdate transport system ATP-binding protein